MFYSRCRDPTKLDPEIEYRKIRGTTKDLLNLVVIGHVDAGKSTLMGHLLCLVGAVSQKVIHKYEQESKKIGKASFMFAWVLDETGEERFNIGLIVVSFVVEIVFCLCMC